LSTHFSGDIFDEIGLNMGLTLKWVGKAIDNVASGIRSSSP
jgi:hypothetical protein